MANYRMTIQYDGTRYSGWQSQHATDATIQGKLETVLTRMREYMPSGRLPIFILSSRAIRGSCWMD